MSEFGELLRHARAQKRVTLRDAERATRINQNHLAALEREDFAELPPLIYARGIVRTYAEYLGLDPVAVLVLFEDVRGQRSGGFQVVPAVKPLNVTPHWAPNFAIIAFMVAMSAVIFAWLYSAYFAPADVLRTAPAMLSTAGTAEPSDPAVNGQTVAQGGGLVMSTPATGAATSDASPTTTAVIHTFEIQAKQRVWVEARLDGETVLATTLEAGETKTLDGEQMNVTTDNASSVRILVDGVDHGPVGTSWDAEETYPKPD
jgi:cytoskeleton protein RodZ